ncbi:MAG: TatD family hydrolase [Symbiobacteriaceae bacterium]|nr:TatD family hydrolase [Symbiobacteriaceae bacterium]
MQLFDTHTHLNARGLLKDLEAVLQRAAEAGVVNIVNVGYDLEASRYSVDLAASEPQVYAAVGQHPQDALNYSEAVEQELYTLLQKPKVVALGEIGLDYYRDYAPRELQREIFIRQLGMAREAGLPVLIHSRDAAMETVEILKAEGNRSGIMHCFSGSWEIAKLCLGLGFHISIAGPVTFPNARKLQEVAVKVPLDRLLIETDCPWLAPQKYRGTRNEPAYVAEVALKIADLRGMDPEELAEMTTTNAKKLFGTINNEQLLINNK